MKRKKISKELVIGLFTASILIGGYFGFNFLKNKNVFSDDYYLTAIFDQAAGLDPSAQVMVQGFSIGNVESIDFDIATKKLTVKMNINGKYSLPINSIAKIASTSMLGSKAVVIELGSDTETLKHNDEITASAELSLMDTASDEYTKFSNNLSSISDKVTSALDGINRAMSIQNTEALSATMANLESTTEDFKIVAASQRANLEEVIANLAVVSASFKALAPDLERGIKNIATMSDSLKLSAPALIENAAKSAENLNAILAKINSGEGSMGKLVSDEEFYVNMNAALSNLTLLLSDLKENPSKYINVTVFGKKDKTKKQEAKEKTKKQEAKK